MKCNDNETCNSLVAGIGQAIQVQTFAGSSVIATRCDVEKTDRHRDVRGMESENRI